MATRTQIPVGSPGWIAAEKENVLQVFEQEREEIMFPAQHEMEWLNEHMAEIFSKTQFNVTDVFKTPGKLKGKTPRTARKRNVQEARIPLTDVFSSNPQSTASPRQTKYNKQATRFEIAKDAEPLPKQPSTSTQNTDSGYHGMTEDEMDIDAPTQEASQKTVEKQSQAFAEKQKAPLQSVTSPSEGQRTTDGSFHSAKEEQTVKLPTTLMEQPLPKESSPAKSPDSVIAKESTELVNDTEDEGLKKRTALDFEREFEDIGSPSDGSTPDRPLVRKSSLTFASLPAREPLPTKKSIGNNRVSRTSQVDQLKTARSSYIGRITGNAYLPQAQQDEMEVDNAPVVEKGLDYEMEGRPASKEESDAETRATRLHNKSSTQRLHEKIDMLGKTQPVRHSKSIPNLAAMTGKQTYPAADPVLSQPVPRNPSAASTDADEDDDWIKPLGGSPNAPRPGLTKSHTMDLMEQIPERDTVGDLDYHIPAPEQWYERSPDDQPGRSSPPKFGHIKSASTVTLVSPSKAAMEPMGHFKNISVSNPQYESTTPLGSPKRMMHSPLSASKSKLQSIMKTAKGLFTSSAGISAAAKMEVLSPKRTAAKPMPGLYPDLNAALEDKPLPPSPPKEQRRTRSSTEREREDAKREKERQKTDNQLEKAREKERQKAADFKLAQDNPTLAKPRPATQPTRTSPRRVQADPPTVDKQQNVQTASNQNPASKTNDTKRPIRPVKDTLQKSKPQPVSIRVGTMSQRNLFPPSNASQATTQESGPSAAARPAAMAKKPSTASLNTTTSTSSFKSSVTSQPGKPKALILAAQKKEQEEREAKRKAEQKRETERKRAAAQEEARRQEQKQRAEAERVTRERATAEESRRNAQKEAVEKRRLEAARKAEQQRHQQNVAAEPGHNKPEAGPPRPPSRMNSNQALNRSMVNHPLPNPAKPAKRPMEDDGSAARSQAPKFGTVSQQGDQKRRRTEDENVVDVPPVRPTMAPPVRQSNIKGKNSMLGHGYPHAPAAPAVRDVPSQMYGNNQPSTAYHPQPQTFHGHGQLNRPTHPMEMAKYTNNKIVFADAPNPLSNPSHNHPHAQHQQPNTSNPFKTPTAPHHYYQQQQQQQRSVQLVKSSPAYPNGENISLPEIPTDSEDSPDSSSSRSPSFSVPSWASPTALQRALMEQESLNGLDPDQVFGPMAPLKMEEIFAKGTHKDRLKRLRDRTSSARWVESGDVLTREEVEKDKVARERIRGEGGWRMGIS